MKPRTVLAEAPLPDGSTLRLILHDGRASLDIHGQQVAGPATEQVETEAARVACAPFRPARQPRLWFAGLGLAHALESALRELPQKRARFLVAEPIRALPGWHRSHLQDRPWLQDERVTIESDAGPSGLHAHAGELHAIVLHRDSCPLSPENRPWIDDPRWLAAAYEALQPGGILVVAAAGGPCGPLSRRLRRAGFEVAEERVPVSRGAKKPRLAPLWLARKRRGVEAG